MTENPPYRLPLALFYLLSSLTYGLWAILEGQMRVSMTAVLISVGAWGFQVPGCSRGRVCHFKKKKC
jgi:hypothetical protein